MLLAKVRTLVRSSVRGLLNLAGRLPARHHVVVYGFPDSEENSLVAATQLAWSVDAAVYLLCKDPAAGRLYLKQIKDLVPGDTKITPVAKHSLKAVWLAASARFVLFTHGLFGNPAPGPYRVYVNLWHGHGPKRTANNSFAARIPSDVIVANTRAYGGDTAKSLGLDPSTLANIGNLRQDVMSLPPSSESLAQLGLSAARPYVVWMPTYRSVSNDLATNWQDSDALSSDASSDTALEELRAAVAASGVDFRVKLHPMDADRLEAFSQWQISDADLLAAGVPLYSFLGGSAGLISDYSSVWVEYLPLDRPLLLFCPDARRYAAGRGFKTPNMMDLASDLIVERGADVEDFLKSVARGQDWRPSARRRIEERLQPTHPGSSSVRLIKVMHDAAARKRLKMRLNSSAFSPAPTGSSAWSARKNNGFRTQEKISGLPGDHISPRIDARSRVN